MKRLILLLLVIVSLTSCVSQVTWQVVKPELNLEKSVEYKAPPAYSGELVELLQASKLSLGVEEYLSVLAGDSVTITETYYQDKSFFPLRGERVKGEFSVYRGEDGVLSFEKGPTVRCETSYPGFLWGVVALYFLVMMAFSHTSENLEIFFLFYGLFSAIYYMLVLVFTVKFGCGYLALWLVLVWLVMLVLGVGIQKLKAGTFTLYSYTDSCGIVIAVFLWCFVHRLAGCLEMVVGYSSRFFSASWKILYR